MPKHSKLRFLNSFWTVIKSSELSKKISISFLFLLFIAASYICFYRLGAARFADWDEAWYAEMTRSMLETKQFIVLQWNGEFLFDKPPLYIWSSALFSSLFGLSEYSVRLTSAIVGFFTIILAAWYSYKKWGIIPSILTFSTLALNNIFIWRVRSGNLDALAAFLIFLAFLLTDSKWKYRYPALGVLFGFIFLAKASLVGFPLIIFILYEVIYNLKNTTKNISYYAKTGLLFIAVVMPWLLLGMSIAGRGFVEYYLFNSDQGVADIAFKHFNTDYFWHTYFSLQRRFFFVFIFGLIMLFTTIKKSTHFLIASFSLLLLILLSFTEKDNNWYLVPAMPFWALTIGFGTYTFIHLFKRKMFQIPATVLVVLLTAYVSQKTFRENIMPILESSTISYQVESAQFAKNITSQDETIARLDHLYPSAIYYSNRRVLSSPSDVAGSSPIFIGRKELAKLIQQNEMRVIIGQKTEVENFINTFKLTGTLHELNGEEVVFESGINKYDRLIFDE